MMRSHQLGRVSVILNAAALVIYLGEAVAPSLFLWWMGSEPGVHTDYIFSVGGPLVYVVDLIRLLPLLMLATGVAIQFYLLNHAGPEAAQ